MGHAKELNSENRAQAVILPQQGLTFRDIMKKLGVLLCAVHAAGSRYMDKQKNAVDDPESPRLRMIGRLREL